MSLADLPLNDQIVEFGFGWHGRHVVPLTGAPYIELPSGRHITAAGIGNGVHPSTFLVDNGMPPVATVLDDPEAALWNVAITNGSGTDNYFRHWARTDPAIRQVRVQSSPPSVLPPGMARSPIRALRWRNCSIGSSPNRSPCGVI